MIGMGMRLCHSQRQELRQTIVLKQMLCDDAPPNAVRGFHGMSVAHQLLLGLGVPGLLIGGLARQAWIGTHRGSLSTRKDVDVVVLSNDPNHHPSRFEGGVDWWITEYSDDSPINGNHCQLVYNPRLQRPYAPGLYVSPVEAIWRWYMEERACFGNNHRFPRFDPNRVRINPLITEYPVIPYDHLVS